MSKILKVAVLSQNAVKSSPGLNVGLLTPDVDVYVEMTQEDSRTPDEKTIINPVSLIDYKPVIQSLTKAKSDKNIVTKLFIKDSSIKVTDRGHVDIGAGDKRKTIGFLKSTAQEFGLANFTKGAVYIKIKKGQHSFLFINMHLPIDTGDEQTLGNDYRIHSLVEIMDKLEEKIDDKTTVFVGGDLNFRIVEENYKMIDQLNKILSKVSSHIRELNFLDPEDIKFTCKFKTPIKEVYNAGLDENHAKNIELEECRNRPFKPDKGYIQTVQRDCGVGNRTPSRCDRFLLMPVDNTVDYKVIRHTAVYLKEIGSDHNAIECVVEFNSNDDIYDNSRLFEQPPPMSRRTSSQRTMRSKRRLSRNSASSNGDSFHSANSSISQSDNRPSRGGTKKRRKTKRKKQTKGRKQRR